MKQSGKQNCAEKIKHFIQNTSPVDYLDIPFTDPEQANAKTGRKRSSCGG